MLGVLDYSLYFLTDWEEKLGLASKRQRYLKCLRHVFVSRWSDSNPIDRWCQRNIHPGKHTNSILIKRVSIFTARQKYAQDEYDKWCKYIHSYENSQGHKRIIEKVKMWLNDDK